MKMEDFRINLQFDINGANKLLDLLDQLPYREVYFMMENIRKQIDSQLVDPSQFENNGEPVSGQIDHPFL
jgi:hypothetical protein